MKVKFVKDLMLPLSHYGVVAQSVSIMEAYDALEEAYTRLLPDRQPPRAVLVVDERGNVVGQIGHIEFLKALEPKYSLFGDLEAISKAQLSADFVQSVMDTYHLLQDDVMVLTRQAVNVKVKDVMRPLVESIDADAPLTAAIHKMLMWQAMRALVTSQGKAVGILRLADLYAEVGACIRVIEKERSH
ncbi:MAG: CBS domain-containing protein [bacterium]|nr:CBS domain-containing protein [bacterium]